jgi:hypothetical protein
MSAESLWMPVTVCLKIEHNEDFDKCCRIHIFAANERA